MDPTMISMPTGIFLWRSSVDGGRFGYLHRSSSHSSIRRYNGAMGASSPGKIFGVERAIFMPSR